MHYFSIMLFSMFMTIGMIPVLRRHAARMNCMDEPCERKTHCKPMPRVGGIAMATGTLIPVIIYAAQDRIPFSILLGTTLIVIFGVIDDVKELDYRTKFAAQISAAMLVIVIGGLKICHLGNLTPAGYCLPDWLAIPFTVFVIIGVTNAVNMADGLDGLAGGIMLMSFIVIAFLAYRVGNSAIALIAMATIGAIFGFLRFNTHPATVFMGDAGSQLLGFLGITMLIAITQSSTPISPAVPLILLGLPIMDTCAVMIERILSGKSPFVADRNHLHHKLLKLNLLHNEAVFIIYLLQAMLVTAAFFLRFHSEWLLILSYTGFSLGILGFLFTAMKKDWRLDRPGVFDRFLKNRFNIHLNRGRVSIRVSQSILESGFLLVLFFICSIPARPPAYLTALGCIFVILMLISSLFAPSFSSKILRALIYFFIPLVIYYGDMQPAKWIPEQIFIGYNLSFVMLAIFAVTTLKTTRRREGFRVTPLDFLILFMALVVPNLPDTAIRRFDMGFLAVKIIVLFFSSEVLIGELRGELKRLNLTTIFAMLFLGFKGITS